MISISPPHEVIMEAGNLSSPLLEDSSKLGLLTIIAYYDLIFHKNDYNNIFHSLGSFAMWPWYFTVKEWGHIFLFVSELSLVMQL